MGKWAVPCEEVLFPRLKKVPVVHIFQGVRLLPMRSLKKNSKKVLEGRRKKYILSRFCFDFYENDYNFAVNTHFWARLKFNSIADFDPLMANDGSFKSWDQAEFVLGLLVLNRFWTKGPFPGPLQARVHRATTRLTATRIACD